MRKIRNRNLKSETNSNDQNRKIFLNGDVVEGFEFLVCILFGCHFVSDFELRISDLF